ADRLATTDRMERDLRGREQAARDLEQAAAAAVAKSEHLDSERQRELQRVAGLSADEARELLLKQIEADVRRSAANLVKRLETEARETAAARAQEIIADAIQRSAAEHGIETTVSVVDLPSDDMKGRIIGREGRNIRALETATGVELIIDDTPGGVILSSFDSLRRTRRARSSCRPSIRSVAKSHARPSNGSSPTVGSIPRASRKSSKRSKPRS